LFLLLAHINKERVKGGKAMSCPYLGKGKVARCLAFGRIGLQIQDREGDADCFSGDFSDCAFLFSPHPPKPSITSSIKALPGLKAVIGNGGRLEPYIIGAR
jgi:hypothetical protein